MYTALLDERIKYEDTAGMKSHKKATLHLLHDLFDCIVIHGLYRISGNFRQLVTFALEIFGKGNFRKQPMSAKISHSRIFIVYEIIHLTKNINTSY